MTMSGKPTLIKEEILTEGEDHMGEMRFYLTVMICITIMENSSTTIKLGGFTTDYSYFCAAL